LFLLISIIILLSINLVYAQCPEVQDGVCTNPSSNYPPHCSTTSGCNEDCHGIIVEGKCYDCGIADNICPEDFDADCSSNPDPDCEAAPTTTCSCNDYDNEADCNEAICNNVNCYWNKGLFSDSCEECFLDITCNDYKTQTTCEYDPCSLNCEWDPDNEKCIEKTITAGCGNGIWEPGEECDGDQGIHTFYSCKDFGLGTGNLGCYGSDSIFACRIDITGCSGVTEAPGYCGDGNINVDESSETYEECDCGNDETSCYAGLSCEDFGLGTGDIKCVNCKLDFNVCSEGVDSFECISSCESYENRDICENCGCEWCVDPQGGESCVESGECTTEIECDFDRDCDCSNPPTYITSTAPEECISYCTSLCPSSTAETPTPTPEEPPFPWYDYWELILTVLILISYYSIFHKRLIK